MFFQIGMIILLLAVYLILSIFRVTIPFPLARKKERIILAKEKLFAGVVVVAFVLCVTGIVKVGMRYKETYQSVTDSVVYVLHYIGDDVEHLNEVEVSDKELWEKQKKEYQKIWTKFSAYEKRMEAGEKVVNADSEKATGTKGFSVVHELTPLHYITSFVPYKDTLFIENEAQYFQYPAFLFSLFFGTMVAWIIGYIRCQKEEVWGVHFITDPVIRILFAMLPVIFLAYEGITDAMQSVYSVIVFLLIEVAWCFFLDLSYLTDHLVKKY